MVDTVRAKRVIPILNFQPTRDFVLFEELAPGETPGGLVLSDGAEMGPPKGWVVAVGPGRPSDADPTKKIPMCCKAGDYVHVMGTVTGVYLGDKKYGLARDLNIVAIAPQG